MSAVTDVVSRVRASAATDPAAALLLVQEHAESEVDRQLLWLATETGLLDGFLDHARDVLLHHAHPWHEAPVETADQDPHSQARFGQAYAVRAAVAALLSEAVRAREAGDRDDEVLGRCALARGYAQRRAGEVVNDVIGVLGASSATTRHGLDRHWRAVRLLAADHPAPLPGGTA